MNKMTWGELCDIYGKWELHFQHGYKHQFVYQSEDFEGVRIEATVGDGDSQTVYKESLLAYSFLEHMNPVKVSIYKDNTWHEVYEE